MVWLISTSAGYVKTRQTLELLTHEDTTFFKSAPRDGIVAWCRNRLFHLVVVHLSLLGAEAIVRRSVLDKTSAGVVFASVSIDTLRRVCLRWVHALRGSNSVIGCSAHRLEAKFVLSWSRHELVSPLLKLVTVHG